MRQRANPDEIPDLQQTLVFLDLNSPLFTDISSWTYKRKYYTTLSNGQSQITLVKWTYQHSDNVDKQAYQVLKPSVKQSQRRSKGDTNVLPQNTKIVKVP